jgi:polyphosphate kinase 2 (PPK2 family)
MDAAGKDGAIKHVMSGVNPQGCQVFSFKHPSPTELQHDFLCRTTGALPERGRIGIFNRSYYEEVVIVRVHPEILHGEELPDAPVGEDRHAASCLNGKDSEHPISHSPLALHLGLGCRLSQVVLPSNR